MDVMREISRIAHSTARQLGTTQASLVAVSFIILWAAAGPLMRYSDTWQQAFNYGTGVTTFIMVFLMQSTQNRDTAAIQLKLDELIRVTESARNQLVNIEDHAEEEVSEIRDGLIRAAQRGGAGKVELEEAKSSLEGAKQEIEQAEDLIDAAEKHSRSGGPKDE